MKINGNYLKALQQVTESRKPENARNGLPGAGFEEQLLQALNGNEPVAAPLVPETVSAKEPGAVGMPLDGLAVDASGEANKEHAALMDEVARILDSFDAYAGTIGSLGGADLKAASATLEQVSNALKGLKERTAGNETPAAFRSMLNELEVMTVTEQFKLNRGDYL